MRLQDIVSVAPRFARAISLERDAGRVDGLDGYVVTTTAQGCLERVAQAFDVGATHRAWTLTGPYGSGKSAFALFLASLLGPANSAPGRLARRMLRDQQPKLYSALFGSSKVTKAGFCPVLVTGSPEPLASVVLRSACRDLRSVFGGRRSSAFRELEELSNARNANAPTSGQALTDALGRVAEALREAHKAQGIVLIIDELGKFLEYASRQPERGDIYLLQQLAERTATSQHPSLLLFTVLHQAFEDYSADLGATVRGEWAKVQGRFEDVGFQEPPEQILDLISHAIRHQPGKPSKALRRNMHAEAERAFELGVAPIGMKSADFVRVMERCAPLHPLAVLCLARLCKKFGQNQRSLFSFLVSREAHGFGSFLLRSGADEQSTYRVAELYDYVADAFGSSLGVGEKATRWAEVQAALERTAGEPEAERRWVKTIGLLAAVGPSGDLKPSPSILQFAEGERSRTPRVLGKLVEKSIVVERRHSGTVALWEGSDIDIDARLAEAAQRLPSAGSLAEKANSIWKPRPLVAKRHSYRTGTLRYFDALFVDGLNFTSVLARPTDADGVLLYALPSSRSEREQLVALAQDSEVRDRRDAVIAIPSDVDSFREAIRELELLKWVQSNTHELQADAVARRELNARIGAVERKVSQELRRLFAPEHDGFVATDWFHRGLIKRVQGGRPLAELLSTICDLVYSDTPVLKNELANRRVLSSAAAAARRTLIDAMIRKSAIRRLGIEGTPPELSIYVSLLEQTGIHRQDEGGYVFGEPTSDPALRSVWRRVEAFFAHCELQRHSISDLFSALREPPFGLKMGVIPVLFCAAVAAHDTEVALYESGGFLPELSVEAFERLLRAPEKFELRRYRVEGVRREVFKQLAQLFGSSTRDASNLVSVVRPIFRFFQRLPAYSRQTRSVSPIAAAVRDVLLASKEPDRLVFEELPVACGVRPLPPGEGDPDQLSAFISTFRGAMLELQRAYDDLLADLRGLLLRAFSASPDAGRTEIQGRAAVLIEYCVEGPLKAFASQVADSAPNDVAWIESIATLLVGKVPKVWHDTERARYEVALAEAVRSFRHVEALVFEETRRIRAGVVPEHVFRVGISDRHSTDLEAVVAVAGRDANRLAEAVVQIRQALERSGVNGERDLALSALAIICREFLADARAEDANETKSLGSEV